MTRRIATACLSRWGMGLCLALAVTGMGCNRDNEPNYSTPGNTDASETTGTGTTEPGVSDPVAAPATPPAIGTTDTSAAPSTDTAASGLADAGAAGTTDTANVTPPGTAVREVRVFLDDMKIEMPTSLPAGSVLFSLVNRGTMDHSFEIEGNGMHERLENPLKPAGTGTLGAELKPGEYQVYCPVAKHSDQGMKLTLTVEEAPAAPATETTTP